MGLRIEQLTPRQARQHLDSLVELLQDAVESGASVGFLPPLEESDARSYWLETVLAVYRGRRILLAAFDGDALVGSVQLDLATMPNSSHRAEVMKLMVLRSARRSGAGEALMHVVEDSARKDGRSLLVLDTRRGDDAERLYERLGYMRAGSVPHFARGADGALHETVYFYRLI